MTRRAVLLAVLVYVTLDVSLPGVPGVFVFEPGDSVDAVQLSRGRLAAEVVTLPELRGGPFVLPSPRLLDLRHRMPATSDGVVLVRPEARCLPRAVCASSPPSSEDPH